MEDNTVQTVTLAEGQLYQIGVQIERQAMGISDKPQGDSKPLFQVVIHMGKDKAPGGCQ